MSNLHPFELAGLGKAPFTCISVAENSRDNHDGTTSANGSCQYCFTGIRYEFLIMSADGNRFTVGSDCVKRCDDPSLTAESAIAMKRFRASKSAPSISEKRQKMIEANNVWQERFTHAMSEFLPEFYALADLLADGKGGFRDDIAEGLRLHSLPAGRAVHIVCDILASEVGRRNSKAYNAEYSRIESLIDRLEKSFDIARDYANSTPNK